MDIPFNPLSAVLTRDILAEIGRTPRAMRALESMQTDLSQTYPETVQKIIDVAAALAAAPYVIWAASDILEDGRVLAPGDGILVQIGDAATVLLDPDSPRNVDHTQVRIEAGTGLTGGGDITQPRTISLADTPVTPGTYGSATAVPVLTIDQQGRITEATTAAIPDYATGTWAPVDASPDGLALTVVRAVYTRIGRMVVVEAQVTYPATTSTNGAALTGLPFVPAGAGAGSYYSGAAAGALYQTGGTLYPATSVGAAVQNSQLSGQTLALTYTYSF